MSVLIAMTWPVVSGSFAGYYLGMLVNLGTAILVTRRTRGAQP